MAKGGFGGFGGGANMNNMIKQAQKLQKQMEDKQKELENRNYEATVGGGAVIAYANGKKQLTDIKIKPEVVDPDDVEMLQDLILLAVNEVIAKAEADNAAEMGKMTGGMNLPGF
ncbi:MAG: DNA-binding protein, YbaB/EbfC family [Firmicutes bacterium]|nr:DNA-binding protein, YbaB/EbfC family [Bacillota bacterium]